MISFIKKHWKAILIFLSVLGISCYFTYSNDYFGIISKFNKQFNDKIKQNEKEISDLEKQIDILEKQNKDLEKEINQINNSITDRFIYIKDKTKEFNRTKEEVLHSCNDVDENIKYINEKFGDY